MVTANIHGSEGEGTDALMGWASYLAEAKASDPLVPGQTTGPTVGAFLDAYELVLVPSVNPDGRTAGTRRNGAGIDLNRDQVTRSQPETKALQTLLHRYQPVMHLDLHGYYNPHGEALGLVEPATTPHAIAMDRPRLEARMADWLSRLDATIINRPEVVAMGFDAKRVGVAMKDEPNGRWDDWAPVYTSVWSTLMNGAGVTVEAPYNPFGRPLQDGKNKAAQGNIAFLRGAVDAMALAAMAKRSELITSLVDYRVQAATGVKGDTGQAWPEGWLIHAPDEQHPKANASHLIENLKAKGVRVQENPAGFDVNGTRYQDGSAFIPANQPLRAVASVTLSPGGQVPGDRTTDLAAWSPGSLWGAQVTEVPKGAKVEPVTSLPVLPPEPILGPGPWQMRPRSMAQVQLVTTWLKGGMALYRNPADGTVYIPAAYKDEVSKQFQAAEITSATAIPDRVERLRKLKVGITADASHTNWLRLLGYDPVYVDVNTVKAVPTDLDVLILNRHIGAEMATSVREWVRRGGALIALEGGQYTLVELGLSDVPTQGEGRRSAGLITVTQQATEPVMPGRPDRQVELVEPYQVWPKVPAGYHAVQTVPAGTRITSGVWPAGKATTQPYYLTVAGEVGQGRVVASGAQRIFRHHMFGQTDELADWIHWAARPQLVDNPLRVTRRIAGADRVETAIALSNETHPDTADTVVITASEAWADTLVAGPLAAAHKAPILLSGTKDIRPSVINRLHTLKPKRILVVGGPMAIDDRVLAQLRDIPNVREVTRLGGETRYATSAAVANTFPTTSQLVIATGDQPADALTGGVYAARHNGVTLLVPNQAPIPDAVTSQVARMTDPELTVIGGPMAVTPAQERTLTTKPIPGSQTPRTVVRLGGQTRFETAAAIARQLAPSKVVALANGYSTADALLATPYVHQQGGVLLLSQPDSLPEVTKTTLEHLAPKKVVLIGGDQVLEPQLATQLGTP